MRVRRGFGALVIASIFPALTAIAAQAAEPEIDFVLRYPFRLFEDMSAKNKDTGISPASKYFKDPDAWGRDWRKRKDLYVSEACNFSADAVLCSETKLGADRLSIMRAAVKAEHAPLTDNSKVFEAFFGSGLRYAVPERRHYIAGESALVIRRPETAADLLHAPRHKVRLFVRGANVAGKTCEWTVDGGAQSGPCTGTDTSLKRTSSPLGTSNIAVRFDGLAQPLKLSGAATYISEHVIVGLGDSFASGEGNPDVPARLSYSGVASGKWPVRATSEQAQDIANPDAAYWVDRLCHRSMLSAQARAALQFAAENPKRETVFVGVGCSGGEINQGVLGAYRGTDEASKRIVKDRKKGEFWRTDMSQINQVVWALCRDYEADNDLKAAQSYKLAFKTDRFAVLPCKLGFRRPIDAVLLSIGGNDIGFARMVAWLLVQNFADQLTISPLRARCLLTASAKDCGFTFDRATTVSNKCSGYTADGHLHYATDKNCRADAAVGLAGKYATLAKALNDRLAVKPAQVILAAYPDPNHVSKTAVCETPNGELRAGLERWFLPVPVRATTDNLRQITKFMAQSLRPAMNTAAQKAGWQVANSHLTRFLQHGWCATPTGKALAEDDLSLAPFRKGGQSPPFNAYAPTQRWFRTINDAFMVQNTHPKADQLGSSKFLNQLKTRVFETYGMFHPNALGEAALADGYLRHMRSILGGAQKDD